MTCLQYKPLLDDYVDGELSPQQVSEIEEHLNKCPDCRADVEQTRRLKELFHLQRPPNPGNQYFEENEQIIYARTVEKDEWQKSEQADYKSEKVRSEFFRGLVSAAAALILLGISIVIGTTQDKNFTEINPSDSPILVMAPIEDMVDADQSVLLTKAEQLNQIKGMLLIGPPGMLGRLTAMYEYNRLTY